MARARNIKPSFFTNDVLSEISALGRLLFIGMWTIADREGRLEDRPKKIKAEVLPYDDCDADSLLHDLESHGFITRYSIDNNKYIQILTFKKHQNPHVKEAESTIPAPDKHSASTVQDITLTGTSRADSLLLIPDSPLLKPEEVVKSLTTRNSVGERDSKPSAGELSAALRQLGVQSTSMNPILQGWIDQGVTIAEATQAVSIARQHKPAPEPIAVRYLDSVIASQRKASAPKLPPKPPDKSEHRKQTTEAAKQRLFGNKEKDVTNEAARL